MLLALLMSAALHDLGHTGTNNQFVVEQKHVIAQMFNDQDVQVSLGTPLEG